MNRRIRFGQSEAILGRQACLLCLAFLQLFLAKAVRANDECSDAFSATRVRRTATQTIPSELDQTHPAIKALERHRGDLVHRTSRIDFINPLDFLRKLQTINVGLPGKFQAYPVRGQVFFFYVEGSRVYVLEDRLPGGKFSIGSNLPRVVTDLRPGDLRNDRFRRFNGLSLVGYERAWNGLIVPIYSESNRLVEFRDMSAYDQGLLFNPSDHESPPRVALEVPLFPIRYSNVLGENPDALGDLPYDLKELLSAGFTLSTIPSLRGLSNEYIGTDLFSRYNTYSALMIADESGQGRTGVLQKNGTPLIVVKNGVEYFLEIKGIGLATLAPIEELVHTRLAGPIRLGRANESQVIREFEGYEVARSRHLTPNVDELPIPAFGVALPEYAASEMRYGSEHQLSRDGIQEFSGQLFRLSMSTRRLSYADNPAFGPRYSSQRNLLGRAREYYGESLAKLRLVERNAAHMHHSPHPQNLVVIPGSDHFGITDFSDIHPKTEPSEYLSIELPDIDQYGVFTSIASRREFLHGIQKVLEPKNQWTHRMQNLVGRRFSRETLVETLESEYLYYFFLKEGNAQLIYENLIPKIVEEPFYLTEILNETPFAAQNRSSFLEIEFRKYIRRLTSIRDRTKLVLESSTIPREFPEFYEEISETHQQLVSLIAEVRRFYQAEKRSRDPWTRPTITYGAALYRFTSKEAQIYDSIESYRPTDQTTNRTTLQQSQWVAKLRQLGLELNP